MGMPPEDEAQLDARLKEIDSKIAELQSERRRLVETRARSRKPVTAGPPAVQQPEQPQLSEKAIQRQLNMLEWSEFKKKEGEWAFLRTRDGQLVEDLKPIAAFIDKLRKGSRLTVGPYEYVASEDRFLNRYPRATN